MHEYRVRLASTTVLPKIPTTMEKWESLDVQYGLEDMFDDDISSSGNNMSIDEEYSAFVNAPLSPAGTPLLKYWEVCYVSRSSFIF
jgi:hypothetical protein